MDLVGLTGALTPLGLLGPTPVRRRAGRGRHGDRGGGALTPVGHDETEEKR